jgi:hypothetical protein
MIVLLTMEHPLSRAGRRSLNQLRARSLHACVPFFLTPEIKR